MVTIILNAFIWVIPASAATPDYPIGNMELVEGSKIQGWAYYYDNPLSITITLRSVSNPSDYRNYQITNTQDSNKIAYFTKRTDVQDYLRTKYGATKFVRPQGFLFTGVYLPAGQWTLVQAVANNMAGAGSALLPVISKSKNLDVSNSQPYVEGYIDSTSDTIAGWVYSSDTPDGQIAPSIAVTVNNSIVDGTDRRTYMIDSQSMSTNVNGTGPIIFVRGPRNDVVDFLVGNRGQQNNYFYTSSHGQMGFQFYYRNVLPPGTWFLESVTANNTNIPFGNTNPSPVLNLP